MLSDAEVAVMQVVAVNQANTRPSDRHFYSSPHLPTAIVPPPQPHHCISSRRRLTSYQATLYLFYSPNCQWLYEAARVQISHM